LQIDLGALGSEGEGVAVTPELAAKLRAVYAEHARVKLTVAGSEGGED